MALHYGQSIFECAKAFMHDDGEIYTFRINKNAERMNRSADIVCIPNIDEQMQMDAINGISCQHAVDNPPFETGIILCSFRRLRL